MRGRKKRVKDDGSLTLSEIDELKDEKRDREENLRFIEENPGSERAQLLDKGKLRNERDYFDEVIHENSPSKVRGQRKDSLASEAEEIRKSFSSDMPTKHEMDFPADHPGVIWKHINWSKKNDKHIRRYKEIMRHLEPHDPTATDIERFRKEK